MKTHGHREVYVQAWVWLIHSLNKEFQRTTGQLNHTGAIFLVQAVSSEQKKRSYLNVISQ